jgi:hypothetical protein
MKRAAFRTLLLASLLTIAPGLQAQGSQNDIGGGCANRAAPTVSGPLSIGSTMVIDASGCQSSAGSVIILYLGEVLPDPRRISLRFLRRFGPDEICDVAILPMRPIDMSNRAKVELEIPDEPVLIGLKLGAQTICNECGFAGCDPTLSRALEITIGKGR